jgi:DNA-directed RNA polymerase subunit H
MVEFDVLSHQLVPKQEILSELEFEEVMKRFKINKEQLPRILVTDPCIKRIGAKIGNVIRITRNSQTAGVSEFFRIVVDIM